MIYGEDEDYCNDLKAEIQRWQGLFVAAIGRYAQCRKGEQPFTDLVIAAMEAHQAGWIDRYGQESSLDPIFEAALREAAEPRDE